MIEQNITSRQNDSEHIRLLRASSVVHRWTLAVDTARWTLALVVGVVAVLAIAFTEFEQAAVFVSIGYAVIGEIIVGLTLNHLNRRGALIQETFDTSLFGLEWKAPEPRPADEELVRLSTRFRGDESDLHNWYVDMTGVPSPVAVLFCQRQNVRWDFALRQDWVWRLIAVASSYLVLGYAFSFFGGWTLSEHATWWIAPALPLLASATVTILRHRQVISARRDASGEVERALTLASEHPDQVDELWRACAIVQARLFETRTQAPRVPNWFYERRKALYAQGFDVDAEGFRARWASND